MQKAIGERFAGIRHLRNGRGRRTTTTTRRMGDDADVDDYQIRRPALPHAPTPIRPHAVTCSPTLHSDARRCDDRSRWCGQKDHQRRRKRRATSAGLERSIQRIAQGQFSVLSIFFLITITTIFPRLRLLCDMAQWPTQG
jgi:hypothetical protein